MCKRIPLKWAYFENLFLTKEEPRAELRVRLPYTGRHGKDTTVSGAQRILQIETSTLYLLAIPAFDRKAGLNNRHLKSNRGIFLR